MKQKNTNTNQTQPTYFHLCRYCGRKLKNINSKTNGYGKACYKKHLKVIAHKGKTLFDYMEDK